MSSSTLLTISTSEYDQGKKCPHCRFCSHRFYRLDTWEPDIEVCASCFVDLLVDGDYAIHAVDSAAKDNEATTR